MSGEVVLFSNGAWSISLSLGNVSSAYVDALAEGDDTSEEALVGRNGAKEDGFFDW